MGSGGKGGGSKAQVTGYRYYFDLLMGICRGPVDQIVAIKAGDIEAWPGNADGSHPLSEASYLQGIFNPGAAHPPGGFYSQSGGPVSGNAQFSINKPNLFGGDKGEGGLLGNCTVMMGDRDQLIPDAVKRAIAGGTKGHTYNYSPSGGVGVDAGVDGDTSVTARYDEISEFRGMVTIHYSGSVCSNNPYPKVWKVRTQRAYTGWGDAGVWYPAKAMIEVQGGKVRSMNPAHIIYQCLTDPTFGRGLDRDEISEESFVYAANYLYDEGFGLNMQWDKSQDISDFMQMVINHINAVLLINRGTGLIELRLIRDDYDPASLPVFTYDSGLMSIEGGDSASDTVIPNELIITWHDPLSDEDRQIRVHNLAGIQSTGAKITDSREYKGIGDVDLARRAGLRDLKMYSGALKKFKLHMDRRAWKMQPGSVMRISAPDRGILDMVVRVITYDDGTATDAKIAIDCAQDVFAMPSTFFSSDPGKQWVGPDSTYAAPPANQFAYEATYYDMQRGLSPGQRQEVTSEEGGVIVVASRPTGNSLSAELLSGAEGGDYGLTGTANFAPTGVVRESLDYYTSSFHLSTGTDLGQIQPGMSAMLGNEMVRVDNFDIATGIVEVSRGVADTIPTTHPPGTVIYFHDAVRSGSTTTFNQGEVVDVSLLTRTSRDVLDPADGITSTVTITGRWAKPYPPGNVQINGRPALRIDGFFVSGDARLTWTSRNKVLQGDQLVGNNEESVAPEALTSYTVQIWDHALGTMLRAYTGLTATSFTYTDADSVTYGDPTELDIKLFTVVDGVSSMDAYSLYVVHIGAGAGGYGNAYGFYYGGAPLNPELLKPDRPSRSTVIREFFSRRKKVKSRRFQRKRK